MNDGMRNGMLRAGLAVLVALTLTGGWWGYEHYLKPSPVRQIEKALARAAEAAQAESVLRLSDWFSNDYRDASGLDRAAMMGQAQRFFAQSSELQVQVAHILHDRPDLPEDATQAKAIVTLKVSGQTDGNAFQGIAGKGSDVFEVHLRREKSGWKFQFSRMLPNSDAAGLLRAVQSPE